MSLSVGIDLGGTNIRAGLVSEEGKLLALERCRTPVDEGPEATAQAIAKLVSTVITKTGAKPVSVGIGCPGPLSRSERKIFQTPNLPGFDGFPIGHRVEEILGIPVCLDNDAKCATYGEGIFGAGRGLKHYVLLTFGTGIGGGVIVGGRMIYGKSDGACEIGHMTLHPDGKLCKCGNKGCFEEYVSATAIERRTTQRWGKRGTAKELFDAYAKNEAWAVELCQEISVDLALATASLVNIFDPQAVIYGGGVFTTGGGPLVELTLREIGWRCFASSRKGLKVCAAELGGDAGVLGASQLHKLER